MCGILGHSTPNNIDPALSRILFLYNIRRGTEATGFTTGLTLVKEGIDAIRFLAKNKIPETKTLIGHTRNSSYGTEKNDDTAHPFKINKITGVHNGKINNYEELAKQYRSRDDVDSYVAFEMIEDLGLPDAVREFEGTMAFAWHDEDDNTVNLYRYSNPIFLGYRDKGMYFSSTRDGLEAIECKDIELLPEHTHLKYSEGTLLMNEKLDEKYRPKRYSFTNRSRQVTPYRGNDCGFVHNQNCGTKHEKKYYNDVMLSALWAPDDAECIVIRNMLHYYWWDNDSMELHVERIDGYEDSIKDSFALADDDEFVRLKKLYPKIHTKIEK